LLKLTPADGQRIVRLVTRRCGLNLLELHPGRVVVHHWGQQGIADLRPFFKQHGLARHHVEVVLLDRKREVTTLQHGDDFLFGERLAPFWPWKVYRTKWQRRTVKEPDDWTAAPHTWSGFAWNGVEPNRIPCAALKSGWQRTTAPLCLNCDRPTLLTNFGFPWSGMFNRRPFFLRVCGRCRRLFEDRSVKDVPRWMVANPDAEVWLDYDMVWDGRKRGNRRATGEAAMHIPCREKLILEAAEAQLQETVLEATGEELLQRATAACQNIERRVQRVRADLAPWPRSIATPVATFDQLFRLPAD
jgi:hypothetical protein